MELHHDLITGRLDAAFLDDVPDSSSITSIAVAEHRLFALMLESDPLAFSRSVSVDALKANSCVLFESHVHPFYYDRFVRGGRSASAPSARLHHVMSPEDALQLVATGMGIAILPQGAAWRVQRKGMTIRPLDLPELKTITRLATRSDNRSRLLSDFVRSYMRLLQGRSNGSQLSLALPK